jgi:SAM-dependent methyltransferase
MTLYWITVLISAFLLFQIQPMAARMILPWFGGGSTVWNACMVFFQTTLLLGYVYAHWLNGLRNLRRQGVTHCILLFASLAVLPILPGPAWRSVSVGHPSLRILAVLAGTVGLPYFALSATSPLLQAWYARRRGCGIPYRLFAVSNFGSLLALLSYPLLVEPSFTLASQSFAWSAGYVCFAALCGAAAWVTVTGRAIAKPTSSGDPAAVLPVHSGWQDCALWVGLPAAASVLLLSLTTHLTQDVAPIPLLWVVPLAAYLLSFVLCFETPGVYRRSVFLPVSGAAACFMAYRLRPGHSAIEVQWLIPLLIFGLFSCCMACHGELARLKPDHSRLTAFYVAVSAGGAMGGLFVGILAPELFSEYLEYPIGLGLFAVLVVLAWAREEWRGSKRRLLLAGAAGLAGLFLVWLGTIVRDMPNGCRVVVRNFYGQLRIRDIADSDADGPARRRLIHGVITHGEQALQEPLRQSPVTYFCAPSGIGRAMGVLERGPRRIGILGLGCGTLAAYSREGDVFRIYEINPFVVRLAKTEFSYLSDSHARVEIAIGDGRLALESEPAQKFDLLVMDAFSGDSVPVHLITQEAFRVYFRHLKPNGILAVNISNRYLDLKPVIGAAGAGLGKLALGYYFEPPDDDPLYYVSEWTLIMDQSALAAHPQLRDGAELIAPYPGFRPWTDDYSGILTIFKTAKM